MIRIHVIRKSDEVDVLLLRNKVEGTFSFVNITKGHICPCRFRTVEDAFSDLERYKKAGKVISYVVISE